MAVWIHEVTRSTPFLSTTTVPSGGICDDGRRDFILRAIALDSGWPGLINRDASCASGTTQCPRFPAVVVRAGVHSAVSVTLCFRINPSETIELSRLWQLPQFVDR